MKVFKFAAVSLTILHTCQYGSIHSDTVTEVNEISWTLLSLFPFVKAEIHFVLYAKYRLNGYGIIFLSFDTVQKCPQFFVNKSNWPLTRCISGCLYNHPWWIDLLLHQRSVPSRWRGPHAVVEPHWLRRYGWRKRLGTHRGINQRGRFWCEGRMYDMGVTQDLLRGLHKDW